MAAGKSKAKGIEWKPSDYDWMTRPVPLYEDDAPKKEAKKLPWTNGKPDKKRKGSS